MKSHQHDGQPSKPTQSHSFLLSIGSALAFIVDALGTVLSDPFGVIFGVFVFLGGFTEKYFALPVVFMCLVKGVPGVMACLLILPAIANTFLSIRSAFNQRVGVLKKEVDQELSLPPRHIMLQLLSRVLRLLSSVIYCLLAFGSRHFIIEKNTAAGGILVRQRTKEDLESFVEQHGYLAVFKAHFRDNGPEELDWLRNATANFCRMISSPLMLLAAATLLAGVTGPALPFIASPFLAVLAVSAIAAATYVVLGLLKHRLTDPGSKAFNVLSSVQAVCVLVPFLWFGLSMAFPAAAITLPSALSFMTPLVTALGPTLTAALSAPLTMGAVAGCTAGLVSAVQWLHTKWRRRCDEKPYQLLENQETTEDPVPVSHMSKADSSTSLGPEGAETEKQLEPKPSYCSVM